MPSPCGIGGRARVQAQRLEQPWQRLHRIQRQRQNTRGHVLRSHSGADGVTNRLHTGRIGVESHCDRRPFLVDELEE